MAVYMIVYNGHVDKKKIKNHVLYSYIGIFDSVFFVICYRVEIYEREKIQIFCRCLAPWNQKSWL